MMVDAVLGNALDEADVVGDEYFRLRALSVLSLLRLCGKRPDEDFLVSLR